MADIVYKVILENSGVKAFTMPGGFWEDVEIHCWGAGGGKGRGGAFGGGGGYAKTTVNIYEGDEVSLQIGQPGTNGGYPAGGRGGLDTSYRLFRGGNSADAYDEDADTGAGGGGGGASWVAVNDSYVCVGAGGGGAGGYGDDGSGGFAGLPGGITTNGLSGDTRGGDAPLGWATGGGGGGGYPKGGKAGISYGDDSGNPPSGSGGQNYGNITVAGSGILPGGTTVSYYPGGRRGEAGYAGYIAIIIRKKLNVSIKNAKGDGTWANVASAYVKLPITSYTTYVTPPGSARYSTSGTYTFVVPAGVTSFNASVTGGGGGGGGGGYGTGGESSGSGGGGGSGYTTTGSAIAVTPGETLTVVVGAGGVAGSAQYSRSAGGFGGTGGTSTLSRGASTLLTAAGGNGGTGGRESQVVAGGTGFNNGSNGQPADSSSATAGGSGGASTLQSGAAGVASTGGGGGYVGITPAPSGSLGSGGAGGGASNGGGPGAGADQAANGGAGGSGEIIISYSSTPVAITTSTGGWKQIQAAWTKVNDAWKPILTDKGIALYDYPVKRKKANITISVNTSDYNLYNNIPIDYFEGLMDIDVWVFANVVITGNSTSTAFTVSNFNSGDNVILHNHGYLAGKGGLGGGGGYRYTSGKNTYSAPASAGGAGGTALLITYPITLLNDGNIAGGGGGGGGSSVQSTGTSKSPSFTNGSQGGGGAGFGPGANNGSLTAGGAGAGTAGAGGSRGQSGVSSGAAGGAAGYAIQGTTILIPGSNVGSYFGPLAT